jgi:NAD(P)-dependent dehydrogenase (short-subunit alcohol dehydrogenase family)
LGHDLENERFVKDWFAENPAKSLINAFAINDHVNSIREENNFLYTPLENFKRVMDVNLTALFSVCRQFIFNNKSGSIVNFSSIYGTVSPDPKLYGENEKDIAYGISKAGVIQLSRHLAVHSAPNFRVNSIVLGGIKYQQNPDFISSYSNKVPLGRMGNLSEISGLVEYLISEKSSYCTGAMFTLDGGWTAV